MQRLKKLKLIVVIAVVAALTVTVAVIGSEIMPVVTKTLNLNIDAKKSASNQFIYNGVTYKNEYEKLLAEDGFIYGMDVNWFSSFADRTTSVGNNNILKAKSGFDAEKWRKDLFNIKALGFNAVNVWMFMDGVGGMLFDENGLVTGLDEDFIANSKTLFEIAREIGIDVVPSIQPHGKSYNYYLGYEDENAAEIAYKYLRFYWDDEGRQAYLEKAVAPLCKLLADYQDVIPMVDLTVENATNMMNDIDTGMFYTGEYGSITWENFASFINSLSSEVKAKMPNMVTSVEDIAWDINFFKYNEINVDIIGRNGYNKEGKIVDTKKLYVEKPMYLGEFNTLEEEDERSDETKLIVRTSFFPNAVEMGYVGGFFFQWDRTEGADLGMFTSFTSDSYESLKGFAVPLANTIRDLKYTHKEAGVDVDKPQMFYYTGGNDVYFLGSRDVESYKVERSENGGAWKTVCEALDPDNDSLVNGLMKFTDTTCQNEKKYSYRITAINYNGDTAVSDPSNSKEYFVPPEMLEKGGFEEGNFDESPWYAKVSDEYTIGKYTTDEAHSGNYSLYVNFSDEEVSNIGVELGSAYHAQWGNNLKELTPNARYELTFWYKDAVRGDGSLSITVRDKDNNNLCWTTVDYVEPDDDTWHKQTVQFVAPADGKASVVLMNSGINDLSIRCYLDDFSVKEKR